MKATNKNCDLATANQGLRRREWVLLPLLSLLTTIILLVSVETLSRHYFSQSKTHVLSCLVLNDKSTGVRGIPNCDTWEKIREGDWVEYKFNCAGYRTNIPCGPKPPGTFRIVMIGSSIAMGERVQLDKTFATLLPQQLSTTDGRKVELYNESLEYALPKSTTLHFDEVLAAKPDLVLWVLTLADVKDSGYVYAENIGLASSIPSGSRLDSITHTIRSRWQNPLSASGTAVRHFLYEQQSAAELISSYLSMPPGANFWEPGAAAFTTDLSPDWEDWLRKFDGYAAQNIAKAKFAGVPLVAVLVPSSVHAAMISMGEWPAGFDPYRADLQLRSIINKHGGKYVDILPDYRGIANPERHYYPIDGHPNVAGHAIIARLLAKELKDGPIPELRSESVTADSHSGN